MYLDEFLLEVQRDGKIKATWTTTSPGGGGKTQTAAGDVARGPLQEHIEYFIKRVRSGRLDGDMEGFELLGQDLYALLFPDAVGRQFEEACRKANVRDGPLVRLWISVDPECPRVPTWPLEYLRCPADGGFFLATDPRLTLARRLNFAQQTMTSDREPPPLKVLVVASRPSDLGGVMTKVIADIATWARTRPVIAPPAPARRSARAAATAVPVPQPRIEVKVLGELEKFEQVEGVEYLDERASYAKLGEIVRKWDPQVVHFIGHGSVD